MGQSQPTMPWFDKQHSFFLHNLANVGEQGLLRITHANLSHVLIVEILIPSSQAQYMSVATKRDVIHPHRKIL
ncbi:hypothetical protein KDA_40580 [Dictyobacter alpinus]|uniref:Uncharacterized protein n=1 Tax=Dictyobacter alpinus TaxID=2014873 RepID=A0A402BB57_9CHLR|nr:hypothetical protein KDA_40580 [Dictyobacter alpinus]